MRCPWCGLESAPRDLHAHIADAHPEGVTFETKIGLPFYVVECPVCHERYDAQIKPRSRDPRFLEEYRREIRLVGFDMLINHLLAEHEGTANAGGPETDGGARDD